MELLKELLFITEAKEPAVKEYRFSRTDKTDEGEINKLYIELKKLDKYINIDDYGSDGVILTTDIKLRKLNRIGYKFGVNIHDPSE